MPWGRTEGELVSVSEREVDGLELAQLTAQPQPPLDAFIDLRAMPDGLALTAPDTASEAPVEESPLADARGFLRHYQQLAAAGDALCAAVAAAIALTVRFGTWEHA